MKHVDVCALAILLFGVLGLSGCEDRGEPTPIELSEERPEKQIGQPTVESADETSPRRPQRLSTLRRRRLIRKLG